MLTMAVRTMPLLTMSLLDVRSLLGVEVHEPLHQVDRLVRRPLHRTLQVHFWPECRKLAAWHVVGPKARTKGAEGRPRRAPSAPQPTTAGAFSVRREGKQVMRPSSEANSYTRSLASRRRSRAWWLRTAT